MRRRDIGYARKIATPACFSYHDSSLHHFCLWGWARCGDAQVSAGEGFKLHPVRAGAGFKFAPGAARRVGGGGAGERTAKMLFSPFTHSVDGVVWIGEGQKTRCSRTAQEIFVLDNASALIEGH